MQDEDDAYDIIEPMKWAKQNQNGFTIVELLIVVVVIAILAAITIVAYNGISQRANASSLQSEVASALKKIETLKIGSNTATYPSEITTQGFASSTTLSYFNNSSENSFCVQSKKGTLVYSATSKRNEVRPIGCDENGLLGWWRLNGNGADSSPNGYNGTLSNTTNAVGQNSVAANALSFAGTSSSNVTVPHNNALNTEPETFSFWMRPTAWISVSASDIITKRDNLNSGYFIAYLNANNVLAFDCGGSQSGNRWVTSYTPPLNSWSHIVFTCSTQSGVALYVNGTKVGSRSTINRSAISTTSPLKFGQDSSTLSQFYDGTLDDIRIYNRVLSEGEAAALYAAGAQ